MNRDHEFWDEMSVACAEVRDAIEQEFSENGLDALEGRVMRVLKLGGLIPEEKKDAEVNKIKCPKCSSKNIMEDVGDNMWCCRKCGHVWEDERTISEDNDTDVMQGGK